jgi:tetratricopeptide (TPR) repeat protein
LADHAYFASALAHERQGELWKAAAVWRELFDTFPKSPLSAEGLIKVADFLVSQGKSDDAKTELLKVIEGADAQPYRMQAQKRLGELLKAQGHLKEAAFYFSEALKKATGDFACEVEFELAEVYETKGDLQQAAMEFFRLSQLYPNHMIYADKSRWRAVNLFETLGQKKEALDVYEKIAESNSNRADEARAKIKKLRQELKT